MEQCGRGGPLCPGATGIWMHEANACMQSLWVTAQEFSLVPCCKGSDARAIACTAMVE